MKITFIKKYSDEQVSFTGSIIEIDYDILLLDGKMIAGLDDRQSWWLTEDKDSIGNGPWNGFKIEG